jgi:hypothetical protein
MKKVSKQERGSKNAPRLRVYRPHPDIADSGTIRLGDSEISAVFPPLPSPKRQLEG